jgi:hypothetical protein
MLVCVKHAKHASGSDTDNLLFSLNDFTPRTASVFHKRPRGRPKGPRGFVFRVPGFTAWTALECARDLHQRAHKDATGALVSRRSQGQRSAMGNVFALHGRSMAHFAFACALAGVLRARGGVL